MLVERYNIAGEITLVSL